MTRREPEELQSPTITCGERATVTGPLTVPVMVSFRWKGPHLPGGKPGVGLGHDLTCQRPADPGQFDVPRERPSMGGIFIMIVTGATTILPSLRGSARRGLAQWV